MSAQKYRIEDFLETKAAGGASWSADGSALCYLSNLSGTHQIYEIARDGGVVGQLTQYEDAVDFVACSPVGTEAVFAFSSGGSENAQFYVMDRATGETRTLTANPKVSHRFGSMSQDGKWISYASNDRNGTDFDIYVMELASGKARMVFDMGGWCEAHRFSPTGKWMLVTKHYTNFNEDLYLLNLENGEFKVLTAHTGDASFGDTWWLPDESGFYLIANDDTDFFRVDFYDMKMGVRETVFAPTWDVSQIALTRDGKYLAVLVNENGYGSLSVYDATSRKRVERQHFPEGIASNVKWSPDGKFLAFTLESATSPLDIWVWNREQDSCERLTQSPCRVDLATFVKPELVTFNSFDGLPVTAFMYLPREQKGKTPAIINIHGGPEAQYRPGFNSLIQYFVYQGFAVIAPNVRGSTGYGKKFMALDDIRLRMDSVKDLVALHGHLQTRKEIDGGKIALMGGSYGGFMVLAGLAFYPELWAAGVDIVGISNFVTFLKNTASYRRALRESEYGYLDKDLDFLEALSPIHRASSIRAPLMIIHGANDPRVPLSEAEQVHAAVTGHGLPSELLVYHDEGHGLAKLKNRLDAYPKVAQFLEKYLAV